VPVEPVVEAEASPVEVEASPVEAVPSPLFDAVDESDTSASDAGAGRSSPVEDGVGETGAAGAATVSCCSMGVFLTFARERGACRGGRCSPHGSRWDRGGSAFDRVGPRCGVRRAAGVRRCAPG
jgi:hypothetical protein